MLAAGSSAGLVHQVHRTIRTALNEAKRKKIITENPAELARAPKVRKRSNRITLTKCSEFWRPQTGNGTVRGGQLR
jgi:hypothetical protein